MKISLIFLTFCVFTIYSQTLEQLTEDYLMTINNWNGSLEDLKQVLRGKMVEASKVIGNDFTPEQVEEFFKEFCKRFHSNLWSCEEYVKWDLEEWGKIKH